MNEHKIVGYRAMEEFKLMLDAFDVEYECYKTTSEIALEDIAFRFDVQSKGGGSVGSFSEWNFSKDGKLLSVKHWDATQEVGEVNDAT